MFIVGYTVPFCNRSHLGVELQGACMSEMYTATSNLAA